MTKKELNIHQLISDIKIMRFLLVLLTLVEVTYFMIAIMNSSLWVKLDETYYTDTLLYFVNYGVAGLFIWYTWKRLPLNKKSKMNATWMMLFLGVIGMWLWIPNDKEINQWGAKQ